MDKKKLKFDVILIAVCLFVSLCVWCAVNLAKKPGEYALVTVNGEEVAIYPLSDDREEIIETKNGKNILVIRDGKADVTDASCPDGLCVRQRAVDKTGETIVCLPNKVTVTIVGGETDVDLAG
ncbi:MAG: NusG domain II-containing protein [Clostridia bacterium]|nr:NusG domain II-containing protein [Clostridia bacterium]